MNRELTWITVVFLFLLLGVIVLVYLGSESNFISKDDSRRYHILTNPDVVKRFGTDIAHLQRGKFYPTGRNNEYYFSIRLPAESVQFILDLEKDPDGGTALFLKSCSQGFSEKNIRLFERNFVEELYDKAKLYLLY